MMLLRTGKTALLVVRTMVASVVAWLRCWDLRCICEHPRGGYTKARVGLAGFPEEAMVQAAAIERGEY